MLNLNLIKSFNLATNLCELPHHLGFLSLEVVGSSQRIYNK